jgi:hypothetical protein
MRISVVRKASAERLIWLWSAVAAVLAVVAAALPARSDGLAVSFRGVALAGNAARLVEDTVGRPRKFVGDLRTAKETLQLPRSSRRW